MSAVVFECVPRPEVDGVNPPMLTWHKGAIVMVRGRHFAPHARAVPTCNFGDGRTVPATVADDGAALACPVPALLRGDAPAALDVCASVNGGADLSASSAMVTVYPPPALREVQPDWASKTAGADVVVRGAHFRPAAGLALRARRGRECCLAEDAFITVSFSREAINVNIF